MTKAEQETERERFEFEKAIVLQTPWFMGISFALDACGYVNAFAQTAWQGWQAARAADPLREELVQALEMVQSEFESVMRNTNPGVRYGGVILFSDQTKEKVRSVLAKAKAGQP